MRLLRRSIEGSSPRLQHSTKHTNDNGSMKKMVNKEDVENAGLLAVVAAAALAAANAVANHYGWCCFI